MIRRTLTARLLAAAVLAAAAAPASAGLLPVSVSVQPEAGNFRWTYAVTLPTDMKLQAGNYFTIYDFDGFVPGSGMVLDAFPDDAAAGFWALSVSKTGPTPDRLNPQDDPMRDNLTWTYNGPTITRGKPTLGNFVATSMFEMSQDSFFTATNRTDLGNEIDSNITETLTPVGQVMPPTPGIPEPATLALAALGLPVAGVARWVRRNRKTA